jgi:hypothetical protein
MFFHFNAAVILTKRKTNIIFSLPNRLFFMLTSVKKSLFFHSGEPTPSTLTLVAEKSLTRLLPLREIRA